MDRAIGIGAETPDSTFQAPGHRQSFTNLLQAAIAAMQANNTALARHKLTSAIGRTDGYPVCGALDRRGSGMDWIVDPDAQSELYMDLTKALDALQ